MFTPEQEVEAKSRAFLGFVRLLSLLVSIFTTMMGLWETLPGFWGWVTSLAGSVITASIAYFAWGAILDMTRGRAIATALLASIVVLPGSVYWSAIYIGGRSVFFHDLKTKTAAVDRSLELAAQQVANEQALADHLAASAERFRAMSEREQHQGTISGIVGKGAVAIALGDTARAVARAQETLRANVEANQNRLARLRAMGVVLKKVAYGGKISEADRRKVAGDTKTDMAALYAKQADLKEKYRGEFGRVYYDDLRKAEEAIEELQELHDPSLTELYQLIQQYNADLAELFQSTQRGSLQGLLQTLDPVLAQAVSGDQKIAEAQRTALESVRAHLEATRQAIVSTIAGYPQVKEEERGIVVAPTYLLVLKEWRMIPGQWLTALAIDYGALLCVLFFIFARKRAA